VTGGESAGSPTSGAEERDGRDQSPEAGRDPRPTPPGPGGSGARRLGPTSRGAHHLWFVDGSYVHCASDAHNFTPRNPRDDQLYRIVDVRSAPPAS